MASSFVALVTVLCLVLLGFVVMVRGVIGAPPIGSGRMGHSLATFLSFATVFKLGSSLDASVASREAVLAGGLMLLAAMVFFDWVGTLVSVAAVGVFLISMSIERGFVVVEFFALLLVYLVARTLLRREANPR